MFDLNLCAWFHSTKISRKVKSVCDIIIYFFSLLTTNIHVSIYEQCIFAYVIQRIVNNFDYRLKHSKICCWSILQQNQND